MDSLDVDQLAGEFVSRDDLDSQAEDRAYRQQKSVHSDDKAAIALAMVSESAATFKLLKEQSARAVARAQDLVSSIAKQLEGEEARAERAETAQRLSEAEVRELAAVLARTRSDLEITRQQLAEKSEELSRIEGRFRLAEAEARVAQQRAVEANAKIDHIVEAIRTQLPSREDLPAPV